MKTARTTKLLPLSLSLLFWLSSSPRAEDLLSFVSPFPLPCHSEQSEELLLFRFAPTQLKNSSHRSTQSTVRRAKHLILLPLFLLLFFFCVFSPKIACEAPEPYILFKFRQMRVARLPCSTRYIDRYRSKKTPLKAQPIAGLFCGMFSCNSFDWNNSDVTIL
jgi:hypothetical protein